MQLKQFLHHYSLYRCLDYGKDPEKTESGKYISAYECDPATVADEFLLAKASYAAMTGREQKKENDVLAVCVRGNDKSVPPLCPAHSQLIADTVRLLRGDLARIEGLSYLIAQHIIFFLLWALDGGKSALYRFLAS